MKNADAFKNNGIDKVFDYTQFGTKIITGAKGTGKTFKVQDHVIEKYRKRGEFFIYIRDIKEEVDMAMDGFWDAYLLDLPKNKDMEFEQVGNTFYVDKKSFGIGFGLSTFGKVRGFVADLGKYRSKKDKELYSADEEQHVEQVEKFCKNNVEKITTIFYDEFIPLHLKSNDNKRLLYFLHAMNTLCRFRTDIEFIFCGNIVRPYDLFLNYFGFPVLDFNDFSIKKSYTHPSLDGKIEPMAVWCHCKPNEHWQKMRDNSSLGKIMRGRDLDLFATGAAYDGTSYRQITDLRKRVILYNITDGVESLTVYKCKDDSDLYHVTARTKNTTYKTYTFNLKNKNATGIELFPESLKKAFYVKYELDKIEYDSAASYATVKNMIPNSNNKQKF